MNQCPPRRPDRKRFRDAAERRRDPSSVAGAANPRITDMTTRLTQQQHAFFDTEGYLIVNDVFTPADLQPVRRELHERIGAKAAALHAAGQLADIHAAEPFDRQLAHIYDDNPDAAKAIIRDLEGQAGGGHAGIEMFRVITHPKLLAVVEDLIGPEIVGSSVYRIRPKLPGFARGVVPWHQDQGYFAPHCDRQLIITCWLPLVNATQANGCLQIQPRAHHSGVVPHRTGGNAGFLVIEDGDLPFPPEQAITAEVPFGGAVFMTNLTPHCSTPNLTDEIRWSLDLRYQDAAVPNNVDLLPVPGIGRQAEAFTMACYPPEADFIVRSRARAERVTTYAEYAARRQAYETQRATIPTFARDWTAHTPRKDP